ncbi:MAG: 23S rRNA (uracil(1939)-C(5))-methyltransferase RlmD, partial [Gemmatimonadales bacterium]|nr:23S rRNA (uracil(1939)-C(5))-methyltransferase RlmD [Gemmatimonadales bacterium]
MTARPLEILRLAAGGDGVGRLEDGRMVFVPRTAPGDLMTPAMLRTHRRFARARLGELLQPGPDRVEPRCPHYTRDSCGGCQLQHLSLPAQLEARRGFVGDALRRLARFDVADPVIEPAPEAFDYRTRITLAVASGGRRIGLHPLERPDDVFDLRWCHITVPSLMRLWQLVSAQRRLLPKGLEQLVFRLDRQGGRHLVAST